MLNSITITAIVAAVWAHPQGISYLEKVDRIEQLSISCGNPCCQLGSGQHRAREEELWKNLREPWQYKPKEEQKIIKFRAFENVETEDQERYFMPMQVAVGREDTRNYMLKQAMLALQSFRQKYGMITELAAVIDAIDALEQQYEVKRAA